MTIPRGARSADGTTLDGSARVRQGPPRERAAHGATITVLALAALLAAACAGETAEGTVDWHGAVADGPDQVPPADSAFQVPPPPFKEEGIFPCSDCHDPEIPVNTERRELTLAHAEIVLRHDEENRWCLACHDADDRDMLHLAGGQKVPFEESYKLCGQCHGDKYRDWRAGVHGRRTGHWDGEKSYLLCVHCHDSHAPAFHPLPPLPPPPAPERTP